MKRSRPANSVTRTVTPQPPPGQTRGCSRSRHVRLASEAAGSPPPTGRSRVAVMRPTLRNNPGVPLILAGVPIGRPGDASERLREVLSTADVVAAEDTRRLKRLTSDLGVSVGGRVVSYF